MDSKIEPYVIYMNQTPKALAIDPACQADPYYRYKVNQMMVQVIGSGKMIKTALLNLDEVAGHLKVPADYIPNYLAKSLGAQAKYEKKKPERERGSISGEYSLQEISDLMSRFFQEFVLCPNCRLPELQYSPGAKKDLRIRCMGCGWKGGLSGLKKLTNEKFKRYVVNNPPPKATKGLPAGAHKIEEKEQAKPIKTTEKPKSDGWSADTSEKAQKERMEAMVPDRLKILIGAGAEAEEKTPLEKMTALLKTETDGAKAVTGVISIQTEHTLDKKATAELIFKALFAPDFAASRAVIKPNKAVLAKFVGFDVLCQGVFLNLIEDTFEAEKNSKQKEAFLKQSVMIFKELYDEEIIEEEQIVAWYQAEEVPGALRKAVSPFCQWLMEAEEESDEEDEDEKKPAAATATAAPAKKPEPEPEEDDLDAEIDAL